MKTKAWLASLLCSLGALSTAQAFTITGVDGFEVSPGDGIIAPGAATLPLDDHQERLVVRPGSNASSTRFTAGVDANATVDSISLNSSVSLLATRATSTCTGLACVPPIGTSFASVAVHFRLETQSNFTLQGASFTTPDGLVPRIGGSGRVALTTGIGAFEFIMFVFEHHGSGSFPAGSVPNDFLVTGILQPGDYTLQTFAMIGNGADPEGVPFGTSQLGQAYGQAQISFSPVPLPAAFWLLASGIGGIVGLRRKRWGRSSFSGNGIGWDQE